MNLLDDLEAVMWWSGDGAVNPTFEAYERLRALLSPPGSRTWLAALPGLLEMNRTLNLHLDQNESDIACALFNALHAAAEAGAGKEGGGE